MPEALNAGCISSLHQPSPLHSFPASPAGGFQVGPHGVAASLFKAGYSPEAWLQWTPETHRDGSFRGGGPESIVNPLGAKSLHEISAAIATAGAAAMAGPGPLTAALCNECSHLLCFMSWAPRGCSWGAGPTSSRVQLYENTDSSPLPRAGIQRSPSLKFLPRTLLP